MSQSWHMVIWRNIMQRIHEGLEYKDFTVPSSVVQKTICTQTGKLAVDGCPSLTEYFDKDTVVKEVCEGHKTEEEEPEETEDNADENTDSDNGNSTTTPGTPSDGTGGSGDNTGDGDNTGGDNTGGGDSGGGNTGGGDSGGGGSGETTTPPAP